MPGPQRGRHTHQSVPLLADQIVRHASVKQRFQFAIIPVLTQLEEPLMAQLSQPGLQRQAQQAKQTVPLRKVVKVENSLS
jgi:hypothetical protein